ncbi:MAG: hypothetical protein HF978_04830 [Desulfobacteraceae bacterium]|nr:hypothetical protein [Desulfobacteraceae bacterium]MBC2754854.1 hypothetical protein [Desulfobacteraceae bacterium]
MQGMVGCYEKRRDQNGTSSSKEVLGEMLSVFAEDKVSNVETHSFGRFSLAIFSNSRTPFSFRPEYIKIQNKHIFFDGFLRDKQEFLSILNGPTKLSIPESIINLSGQYNIVIFDESTDELVLVNDRHGSRYLYYYNDQGSFVFAPNPKVILSTRLIKDKELDYQAIISLLSHEYIIGDRSLVKGVKLLPHASYVKLTAHDQKITRYWNFNSLSSEKHSGNYDKLIETGISLTKKAIESFALDDAEIIIPLSGGMDSRTISCFLSNKANIKAIHMDYSFEKKLAAKIAGRLEIDLEIRPLESTLAWEKIDPFIACASNSLHQFWLYPHLKNKIDQGFGTLIVDGYLMNEVIGGLSTLKMGDYSQINQMFPPLNPAFDFILGPKIRDFYHENHDFQVAKIVSNCPINEAYEKYLYFTILNYGRRFTLLMSTIHQYLSAVGLPVLDYDLMDFCLRLPMNFKKNSRFYRDIVCSAFPEVVDIPWSRNRLPLNSDKNRHLMYSYIDKIKKAKYYLSRITHARIEYPARHDKNRWFRKDKDYRDYFMNLIFDDRTFDKGYVSKAGLEKIVCLIDTGRNYFDILEKVALIEIVSRELGVG